MDSAKYVTQHKRIYINIYIYKKKAGMCKRNVQSGCTGYIHIAAMRMMANRECFTVY